MEIRSVPGCGRAVFASQDYSVGDIVIREDTYAMVPLVSNKAAVLTCIACLSRFSSAAPHPRCQDCNEHFCSEQCFQRYVEDAWVDPKNLPSTPALVSERASAESTTEDAPTQDGDENNAEGASADFRTTTVHGLCAVGGHKRFGECRALALAASEQETLNHDDFNTLRAIVVFLMRAVVEFQEQEVEDWEHLLSSGPRRLIKPKVLPDVDVVCPKLVFQDCSNQADAVVVVPCDPVTHLVEQPPSFAHSVARLTANVFRFEEDQLDTYRTIYESYQRIQEEQDEEDEEEDEDDNTETKKEIRQKLPEVSEVLFLKLCCAYQCNGFSLWDDHEKEVASGVFGFHAMINNSCQPNVKKTFECGGRRLALKVLKTVKKGEQLCLAYCDPKLAYNVRQWRLSTQYFFACLCPKCKRESK